MRAPLLAWFDREARPLPWRAGGLAPAPVAAALRRDRVYVVWIVETMSQQTRIETVVARLPAFLERFPDLASLAAADLDAVMAAWAGLGYYRRARALHAAARVVAHERGGVWPATAAGWRTLPGVGPYTAAAVAAQAFGAAEVALDANVRRLGARLLGAARPSDRRLATELAGRFLDGAHADPAAAGVAEALVELGARICTPRAPRCDACPLAATCAAAASGEPTRFPAPRRRAAPRPLVLHAWLCTRREGTGVEVALERRPDAGLWGGLHGPPWRDEPPTDGVRIGEFTHVLTHRRVRAVLWRTASPPADAVAQWAPLAGHDGGIGLAAIDRRALRLLVGGAPEVEGDRRRRG
jgi:A/G-specific adenine glycosylase